MPNWFYWLLGTVMLLIILYLVGVRFHLTTGG